MIKFQKNKNQLFECKIKIEGANKSNAKPRLILYPESDNRNMFFEGKIENGVCKIHILPNLNITNTGKAVLEVIVEDSILFQPWSSEYEIVSESVTVESVNLSKPNINTSVTIIQDDIKINKEPILDKKNIKKENKKGKFVKDPISEAARMIKDDIKKNDKLIKIYSESIAKLSKLELKSLIEYVRKKYTPSEKSIEWSNNILGECKSTKSKILMYCNDISNKL